mmetsp:Transcript_141031/g.451004  ORF Transcript_141031/g.451004 Transcript_141031/m.451004 type:complete len:208 (+) Transcript_141031:1317-1940(+)
MLAMPPSAHTANSQSNNKSPEPAESPPNCPTSALVRRTSDTATSSMPLRKAAATQWRNIVPNAPSMSSTPAAWISGPSHIPTTTTTSCEASHVAPAEAGTAASHPPLKRRKAAVPGQRQRPYVAEQTFEFSTSTVEMTRVSRSPEVCRAGAVAMQPRLLSAAHAAAEHCVSEVQLGSPLANTKCNAKANFNSLDRPRQTRESPQGRM